MNHDRCNSWFDTMARLQTLLAPISHLVLAMIVLHCIVGIDRLRAQPPASGNCGLPGGELPRLEAIWPVYYDAPYRAGLLIEENLVKELFPFLTYIFFEEGKSTLPARYTRFADSSGRSEFHDAKIPGGTLEKYRHVLNIIGFRMRTWPKTKISIVGYDSKQPAVGENSVVAEERAVTVRSYLLEVWGIEPRRIRMLPSGGLPRNRSNTADSITNTENRRVEILSDDWEITRPIIQQDFRRYPEPETVVFQMSNGMPEELIQRREIEITRYGKHWQTITQLEPSSSKSPEYNWGRGGNEDSIPTDESPFVAQLVIYMKDGSVCRSQAIELPVLIIDNERKRRERLVDMTRDIYSLFLFDFERSRLGAINTRIVREFITSDICPAAKIEVAGYASQERNDGKLAVERARAVEHLIKKLLGPGAFQWIKSTGPNERSHILYDESLPEGRFYNRTVQVRIETPTGATFE